MTRPEPDSVWKVSAIAGFRIETESGEWMGDLADVLPTGGNDVFVARRGPEEILIPALKSVVLRISTDEKKIVVRLPAGLKEIYVPPATGNATAFNR